MLHHQADPCCFCIGAVLLSDTNKVCLAACADPPPLLLLQLELGTWNFLASTLQAFGVSPAQVQLLRNVQ